MVRGGCLDYLVAFWDESEAGKIGGEMREGRDERGCVGVEFEGALCAQAEVQVAEGPGVAGDLDIGAACGWVVSRV